MNTGSTKDTVLCVSPAAVLEYERQSGLVGICQILERRGLIKITNDAEGSA
jgi:hypothetical protein